MVLITHLGPGLAFNDMYARIMSSLQRRDLGEMVKI